MKDVRLIVKLVCLILFSAFTATTLIQYVADFSFLPVFLSLSFVLGIVFFIGNKKLLDAAWIFATSAEIIIVWNIYFGNLSIAIGIMTYILLLFSGMLFLKLQKYSIGSSILNSFTALTMSSTLVVLTSDSEYMLLAELLVPVVCSIFYVLWSGRFSSGVPTLITNSIISLTLFYGFTYFIGGEASIAILVISLVVTLFISLSFNQNNSSIFQFGYQRFQQEQAEIQQDIQRLNWNIANEKQLQSEELLHILNQLKEVQLESPIDKLLGRTIQRHHLHIKEKLMKTYTLLITASASCLFISSALYLYDATKVSPMLLIGSFILYTVIMFYLSRSMMKIHLIQFINKRIIMPFNLLVFERQELIKALQTLLEDRGVSTVRSWEMEEVYYTRSNKQRDIPLLLREQPITE